MPFTRKEFRRLNQFENIYHLVSGGRDSLYTTLKLMEHCYWLTKPITLLFTDTGNETESALRSLTRLNQAVNAFNEEITPKKQWSYKVLDSRAILPKPPMYYIKQAFLNIPRAREILKTTPDKYSKKIFPCCYYLKHKIFYDWIRRSPSKHANGKSVFISSIRSGESLYRMRFLLKLKKAKTHFWLIKRLNVWYYYPLRDIGVAEVNKHLTQGKSFMETKHSGCRICPILVLFNITSEGERYNRSRRMYLNFVRRGLIKPDPDWIFNVVERLTSNENEQKKLTEGNR